MYTSSSLWLRFISEYPPHETGDFLLLLIGNRRQPLPPVPLARRSIDGFDPDPDFMEGTAKNDPAQPFDAAARDQLGPAPIQLQPNAIQPF